MSTDIQDLERMIMNSASKITSLKAENEALRSQLEYERIRLAACGAAALANTEKSIQRRITSDNEYYSASYGDVCRAVDREMKYRSQLVKLREPLSDAVIRETYLSTGFKIQEGLTDLKPYVYESARAVHAALLARIEEE